VTRSFKPEMGISSVAHCRDSIAIDVLLNLLAYYQVLTLTVLVLSLLVTTASSYYAVRCYCWHICL